MAMASSSLLLTSSTLRRHLLSKQRRFFPPINTSIHSQCLFSSTIATPREHRRGTPPPLQHKRGGDGADSSSDINNPSKLNNTQQPKRDWRDWFRSSDYDDPWSSYQPLHEYETAAATSSTSTSTLESSQNDVISSILDGTWVRRRHGMNLEPLRIIHSNLASQGDAMLQNQQAQEGEDNSNELPVENALEDERTVLDAEEEQELMDTNQRRMHWIDSQSRFLCRMLDDLYRTGVRRETDRPRTERCHRAIGKLLTMTPENPPKLYELQQQQQQLDVTFSGLAQRAGAILQRMEKCSPPIILHDKQSKTTKNAASDGTTYNSKSGSGYDDALDIIQLQSYQGIYDTTTLPPHLAFTKYALPTPTPQIYNMVLKSYAKESSNLLHVAQQAEDVIWSMISRALQQVRLSQYQLNNESDSNVEEREEEDNNNDTQQQQQQQQQQQKPIFPSIEDWNCILKCWSRCTHPDRAYHAYSFLRTWLDWNDHCRNNHELQLGGNKMDDIAHIVHHPNQETYQLLVESCLAESPVEFDHNATEYKRAREMGSGIAIRLWKEYQNQNRKKNRDHISDGVVMDSNAYYEILRAICQTSALPAQSSGTLRTLKDMARVFRKCSEDGMVTPEILEVVRGATTEKQLVQLTETNNGK